MQQTVLETPEDAERAFYRAFARADLEGMMRVWADDEQVACIHPLRDAARGRRAVEESWREIFAAGLPMRFEVVAVRRSRDGDLAVRCGEESIHHGPRLPAVGAIRTILATGKIAVGKRFLHGHHNKIADLCVL